MSRAIAPFGLRIPPDLKQWLEERAKANGRSMNAEIVVRLQESYEREQKREIDITERLIRIETAIRRLEKRGL